MSKLSLVKKKTYCEYMSETWRQTLLGQNPSFFGISNHQHQIRNLYSINLWHVRFWHHLWYVWNCKYWGSQPSYEMVTLAGPRLQLWQSKGRNLGTPSAHLRGRSGKILGNPCEKYAFVIGHHYPIWIHMFAHGWTWFNMVEHGWTINMFEINQHTWWFSCCKSFEAWSLKPPSPEHQTCSAGQ